MKIVIDARLYGLENAGLGRYVNNLISNLVKLDKKNSYVVLLRKKYYDTIDFPANWTKVSTDFRHYSFEEQVKLPFILKKLNPDLVHFPHFNVPVFYTGKYIVTIHDMLMHSQKGLDTTTHFAPFYFLKRFSYYFVFKVAILRSKKILTPSLTVKNDLVKFYKINPEKIVVAYEGVDSKIAGDKLPTVEKPYFLYVGNAYPHKNLKRLIEATVLLNTNSDRKINLVIVSSRSVFAERLTKIVKDFGAGNFVSLLWSVDDAGLSALYKNAVAFITPSISEGFGLPGLEAMEAGTVVLASQIPVFKEIYDKHATYFNQLDFSSIEKCMRQTLEINEAERKRIIDSGLKFVKKYSWEKMASRTLEIYTETVKT